MSCALHSHNLASRISCELACYCTHLSNLRVQNILHGVLPGLVPNPHLQDSHAKSRHTKKDRDNDPNQRGEHEIARSAFALRPLRDPSARLRMLQLFVQVREAGAEIVVRDVRLVRAPDSTRPLNADAIRVEGASRDERVQKRPTLAIRQGKQNFLEAVEGFKSELARECTSITDSC